MMIDSGKKKLIAIIAIILAVIWSVVLLLTITGAFNEIKSVNALVVIIRIIGCIVPIMLTCLSLIPLLNEDMPIISYISIGISAILLIITLFTDGLDSDFFSNIITVDFLILIICTVRTTSNTHKIFKYIMFALTAIAVFVLDFNLENDIGTFISLGFLTISDSSVNLPIILTMLVLLGLLINPCVAAITEDDAFSIGLGGGSSNKKSENDRSESPLEMYNRLLAEQQTNSNPTTEAPVATPPVAPPATNQAPEAVSTPNPIGPNTGAVINPFAVTPEPVPEPAPVQQPESAEAAQENFEVPASMAFLFEDNQDKSN